MGIYCHRYHEDQNILNLANLQQHYKIDVCNLSAACGDLISATPSCRLLVNNLRLYSGKHMTMRMVIWTKVAACLCVATLCSLVDTSFAQRKEPLVLIHILKQAAVKLAESAGTELNREKLAEGICLSDRNAPDGDLGKDCRTQFEGRCAFRRGCHPLYISTDGSMPEPCWQGLKILRVIRVYVTLPRRYKIESPISNR